MESDNDDVAMTTVIKLLSAGAVQPGLSKVILTFRQETGYDLEVTFATAPAIRERLAAGEALDVLIAPSAVVDDLARAGKSLPDDRIILGGIGVGVMIRAGAPLPKIATVDELKQSLLATASIVFNQASTGIYLERLFDQLEMSGRIKPKITRYPDAKAVLDHVRKGKRNEIGFGATTVIIEAERNGLQFVGPLPAEIQNYTTYAATVLAGATAPDPARDFVRYLTTAKARETLATAGIA